MTFRQYYWSFKDRHIFILQSPLIDNRPDYPGHCNTILESDILQLYSDPDRDQYMYCRDFLFYHAMDNEKNESLLLWVLKKLVVIFAGNIVSVSGC